MANKAGIGCGTFLALVLMGGCIQLVEKITGVDVSATVAGASASPTAPAAIPDMIGKQVKEAKEKLEALGMTVKDKGISGHWCWNDDCVIYSMQPKPGAVVQPGTTVKIRFVTAKEHAWYRKHRTMPKVIGLSSSRTDALFEPVRITVTESIRKDPSFSGSGYRVMAQSPKPGVRLRVGQKIKLVIGYNSGGSSSGSDNVDIDVDVDKPWVCSRSKWC
jgi:beta-lactam-binding protein with PASTA domain